ncbi:MAG: type II toxin-antitoxin system VapC family toxin [Candidatus Tectomicrobia bacterium]|nr:type II toxin-antitoxin system VapC family toxin [Candidatus Tectomicrobia bacterium]
MTPIVIDSSVFLAWCLADEEEPTATGAMRQVTEEGGVAPRIWWYELRNALLMNERRGRISSQQVLDTLTDSLALGISMDDQHDESQLLELARRYELTVYDAAYLEVAFRRGLPLATLDSRLRGAAKAVGVAVVQHHD